MAVLVEVTRRHREARAAVAGAYLVQGLCFAAVRTQVPALKQKFGFTDGELALILLAVPVVAGGGSLLAGLLAPRLGSRPVLRVAGLGVCAAMVGIGLAGSRAALIAAVTLLGLVLGAVDATMNMQGVAVQRWYGRSILASFHGVWSLAGIAGALATAAADRLDLALPVALGVVAAVGVAPTPWLGIVGFAIVGAGLCVVVPLSFTTAGTLDPTGSGVAIARVNLFNYAGFVVGAALIGIVAEAAGRRWAFAVPAGLAVLVVTLARSFQVRAAR